MLKKILSVILALCMVIPCCAPVYAESGSGRWIKVGLYYGSTARQSSTVKCSDGFLYCIGTLDGYALRMDLSGYTQLEAVVSGSHVEVYDPDGTLVISNMDSAGVLMSAASGADNKIITIDGDRYRDGVSYLPNSNGKLTVINYVDLEHYLWSVVGAEIGPSYPIEAIKAQAVAARSYAIANASRHKSQGFELCDSTDCQAYKGLNKEYSSTIRACRETEGLVISYGGRVVNAYYYASSGGYTMNSEDVWVSSLGYLRSVKDDFCSDYTWNSSITISDLYKKLRSKYSGAGEIISVEATGFAENGAVTQLTIETTNGPYYISKGSITSLFGSSVLKSVFFSMGAGAYPGVVTRSSSGDGLYLLSSEGVSSAPSELTVLGAGGETTGAYADEIYLSNGSSTLLGDPGSSSAYTFTHEKVYDEDDVIYFSGVGSGHGVGMPQTSMRNMANAGYSFRDILSYYYTGISITSL